MMMMMMMMMMMICMLMLRHNKDSKKISCLDLRKLLHSWNFLVLDLASSCIYCRNVSFVDLT